MFFVGPILNVTNCREQLFGLTTNLVFDFNSATRIAVSGVGSPGNETNYFGSLTKSAVIRFQEKYRNDILAPWGFANGTGYVGRTTMEKLNELLGE